MTSVIQGRAGRQAATASARRRLCADSSHIATRSARRRGAFERLFAQRSQDVTFRTNFQGSVLPWTWN